MSGKTATVPSGPSSRGRRHQDASAANDGMKRATDNPPGRDLLRSANQAGLRHISDAVPGYIHPVVIDSYS